MNSDLELNVSSLKLSEHCGEKEISSENAEKVVKITNIKKGIIKRNCLMMFLFFTIITFPQKSFVLYRLNS